MNSTYSLPENWQTLPREVKLAIAVKLTRRPRTVTSPPSEAGDIPFCPHTPTDRQAEFLALDCREAMFGGSVGGGKSDALLMAALQYVHVPGYSALLLRRTFVDLSLPGALMDRGNEWWRGTAARWRDKTKTWIFPSGATITFGHLDSEADKYAYQGSELNFCGFDELSQFTETQYTYLFSRLRRKTGVEVPLRMRAASNPGGVGHEWVRDRFIVQDEKSGRRFVPARLEDNPHLDRAAYEESLAELDHVTRAQLRMGDWEIRADGNMFRRHWFPIVRMAPSGLRVVRYWDLAATQEKAGKDPDWTVGALLGRATDNRYYLLDVQRIRETPATVETLVKQTAAADRARFGAVQIVMEQEPGASGLVTLDHYRRNVLSGYHFSGNRCTGDKTERARPVSSQAEGGNILLVEAAWNHAFLNEIVAFPTAGVHDDQVDGLSGAFQILAGPVAGAPAVGGQRTLAARYQREVGRYAGGR